MFIELSRALCRTIMDIDYALMSQVLSVIEPQKMEDPKDNGE